MIFDFIQIIDFNKSGRQNNIPSFFSHKNYEGIKGEEKVVSGDDFLIKYLERPEKTENIFTSGTMTTICYGSVFSNNAHRTKTGRPNKRLSASEVHELFRADEQNAVAYIKGSFCIVRFDAEANSLQVITDRLNVIPFYYYFSDGLLIISSSVRQIISTGIVSTEINKAAILQLYYFDYFLGDNTYFEGIWQTENGKIYSFSSSASSVHTYWTVEELYNEKLLSKSESLEVLSTQLFENVDLYTSDSENVLVSLTGGFDGRTNVAMIRKPVENFLCYSYGMPGSKQIDVPMQIKEKLGINYQNVPLDDAFVNQYSRYSKLALEFSNFTAPVNRANYPYAFSTLNEYSNVAVTGLFGSEILRPLHVTDIIANEYADTLFLADNWEEGFDTAIARLKKVGFLADHVFDTADELKQLIYKTYIAPYQKYDKITRYFFFIINEGIRKYFMQEIQSERAFVTTRFPYLDDDLVALMYKTPFAGMYNGFLKKSKFKRRKGQLLYAHIMKKYKPALLDIELDRGYTPGDLLKIFPYNYYQIYKGVKKARKYNAAGDDTFNSFEWTKPIIEESINNFTGDESYFPADFREIFTGEKYKENKLKFYHAISFRFALQELTGKSK